MKIAKEIKQLVESGETNYDHTKMNHLKLNRSNTFTFARTQQSFTRDSTEMAKVFLQTKNFGDFVATFSTMEDYVQKDKKVYMKRLQKIIADTGYSIDGDWEHVTIRGNVFPYMFVVKVTKAVSESTAKSVNYTVKAVLHFDDGVNKGNLKVRALDAQEAEKAAREKLKKQWKDVKKIEIISVKKG